MKRIYIIILMLVLPVAVVFALFALLRLIGAVIYNLTGCIMYRILSIQETKDTAIELVSIPSQVYEVWLWAWTKIKE